LTETKRIIIIVVVTAIIMVIGYVIKYRKK
jgi:hypothetical protein